MKQWPECRSIIKVTIVDPGSGSFKTVSVDEVKTYTRYGWRYATYDECLKESKKRKDHDAL